MKTESREEKEVGDWQGFLNRRLSVALVLQYMLQYKCWYLKQRVKVLKTTPYKLCCLSLQDL